MATRANSGGGNLLAFVAGIVLIVAIVGAPFSARFLQSSESRLSDTVREDVESIRRIVLNIDENLAGMNRLAELSGADANAPLPKSEDLKLSPTVLADLEASSRALKKAADEDQKRNLELPGTTKIQTGAPQFVKAATDVRQTYATANDKLLKDARQIANRIKAATQGEARGADLLSVNRILAILNLAEGRMNANQAEFDRLLAADFRSEAERRLLGVSELRMAALRADAEKPSSDIESVNADIAKADGELNNVDEAVSTLKSDISERETQLAAARAAAKAARDSMAGVDPKTVVGATGQQYETWSTEARKAEATIAALRFGTLEGAQLPAEEADDLLTGKYEGGKPVLGLRDLKLQLAEQESRHALLSKYMSELEERKKALQDRESQLATVHSEMTGEAGKHTDEILAKLDAAKKLDDGADKTSDSAVKLFKEALTHARKADTAASARKRAAGQAGTSAPGAAEKAADRMVKDGDTQAAMQVLAGELSYQIALEHWRRIRSMQAQHAAQTRVAEAGGGSKPADIDVAVDAIRTEALAEIDQSIKSYTSAAGLIKQSTFKGLETGSISGAQSVWQVQVAQAAAGLLKSQLITEPVDATTARDEAYTLLGEAVKGREGSPLLTPALGTFLYLQKAAAGKPAVTPES